MQFYLDLAPIPWHRPGRSRSGHRYQVAADRTYQRHVRDAVLAEMYTNKWRRIESAHPVELHLNFYLERGKTVRRRMPTTKPDLDNLEKNIKDALNGVAWHDDAQVCDVTKKKRYATRRPYIEIRIIEGYP